MASKIILDYKSPPVYVGYEYIDEDLNDRMFKITKILSVEVNGAETSVHFEQEEIFE